MGISVTRSNYSIFLSQRQYLTDVLQRAHMADCNPCTTHVNTSSKLSTGRGPPIADPTVYRSLAKALQYLTFTRSYISYVVQHMCLFMHDPRAPHLAAFKLILRYLRGTIDRGLFLPASLDLSLTAYSDAD